MEKKYTLGAVQILVVVAMLAWAPALLSAPQAQAQAQSSGNAFVRVVHASFDGPGVDVYVNGTSTVSNLQYRAVSPFVQLPAGSLSLKVTPTGQSNSVTQNGFTVQADKYYTVIAAGKFADLTTKVVEDSLGPVPQGEARLRVVHASPDTPAVDVRIRNQPAVIPNLGFLDVSSYFNVDAKDMSFDVYPSGSTQVSALSINNFTPDAGKTYTLYVTGLLEGSPALSVLPVVDDTTGASTPRVAQALPAQGPPPVTLSLNTVANSALLPVTRTGGGENGDSLTNLLAALSLVALTGIAAGLEVRRHNQIV